jgi:hypothetical protein
MSTFKFSCPRCGQHLSGEAEWAGQQIQCPSCQNTIVVPAPAPAGLTVAPPPPGPPPVMQQPTPAPARRQTPAAGTYSGLAIATLIVGVMTIPMNILTSATAIPFFLLTAIPTILMGHKAVEAIERHGQKGKIIARIGMFFAYAAIFFGIIGYSIIGYHRFMKNERWDKYNRRWLPAEQVASSRSSTTTTSTSTTPRSTAPKSSSPTTTAPAKPADPKVTTDPLKAEIPNSPVSGTVRGQEFKFDGSIYNTTMRTLDFRQGRGATPEASVTLYLFTPAGETLDGKTLVYPSPGARSIHIYVKSQGTTLTELRNYAMRLEFGKTVNKKLPGKIYLELPESAETKIAGTFEAYIR